MTILSSGRFVVIEPSNPRCHAPRKGPRPYALYTVHEGSNRVVEECRINREGANFYAFLLFDTRTHEYVEILLLYSTSGNWNRKRAHVFDLAEK